MTEKYTGTEQDKRYTGEEIDITFNAERCIHAKFCVNRLAEVFDVDKRPWIDPDGATAERAAEVIEMCPSGALHYERKDGGPAEETPVENEVYVWKGGPLEVSGDLTLDGATVAVDDETRVTLCRCGGTDNPPFCNNAHLKMDFEGEVEAGEIDETVKPSGSLAIKPKPDGPLAVEGNMVVYGPDKERIYQGEGKSLCRCGASSSKPFCDGTHNKINFEAP